MRRAARRPSRRRRVIVVTTTRRLGGGHALAKRIRLWCPEVCEEIQTHQRPLTAPRSAPLARRWDPLGPIWRQTPGTRARPFEERTHARPERAPHSPTSASGAQPNAPQRPAPDAREGAPRWVGNSTRRNILPSETWKCHMRSKSR